MRWVKFPTDFGHRPEILRLRDSQRWTFTMLYALADRSRRRLGQLVDERSEPLSVREIGRRVGIKWPTIRSRVDVLIDHQLIYENLGGCFVVPLVIEYEQSLTKSGRNNGAVTDEATNGRRTAVDNAVEKKGGSDPEWFSSDGKPAEMNHPLLSGLENLETTYVPSTSKFSTPNDDPLLGSDYAFLVAEDVTSSDARFLLGKLAQSDPRWYRFLVHPRDQRTLRRLNAESPAALVESLRQAQERDDIGNPGAWLTRTVPAVAADLEEAR
jgi:hypothetical protein